MYGTITGITAIPGSGILTLVVKNDQDGTTQRIPAENGPTVRALMGVFGEQIVQNHTIDVNQVVGQHIQYSLDEFGMLASLDAS